MTHGLEKYHLKVERLLHHHNMLQHVSIVFESIQLTAQETKRRTCRGSISVLEIRGVAVKQRREEVEKELKQLQKEARNMTQVAAGLTALPRELQKKLKAAGT